MTRARGWRNGRAPVIAYRALALMAAALALSWALAARAAAQAQPAVLSASVIDGPTPDLSTPVDLGASIARDGTGGAVYLKQAGGQAHVFVSRLAAGLFQAPVEVDAGLASPSSQPVIAAGNGGLLVVAFINGGQLYVVDRASASAAYGGPVALADGASNPAIAITNLGKAYLAFARSEPAYYSAMFEAGIPLDTSPDLVQAGDDAFGVLRRATDALIATMPASQRPPVGMMALHVWSLSHGVASLFARGDAGRRKLPMSAEELLEAGILVYLRGLGVAE